MKESAYKKAGVDIEAGAELVERIKPHVKKTNRTGVVSGLGGFGAFFDLAKTGYKDPVLVSATDGVGTKLKIAIESGHHGTVGIDLVAMCVNDLVVQGAEPLFFLDYFACGKLENDIAESVIAGIAEGCHQAGCALIGGETAEMPGMYAAKDYDLAGFSVGAVERDEMLTGDCIKEGDVVLGLASSGLHSNGYSLVRRVYDALDGVNYDDKTPFDESQSFADVFLTPTKIYVKSLLAALKLKGANDATAIKGLAHITGGGLVENLPRILPAGLGADIDAQTWDIPAVFSWLADKGDLSTQDMALTFNCGIGMVVICAAEDKDMLVKSLQGSGETVSEIGTVTSNGQINIAHADQSWRGKK